MLIDYYKIKQILEQEICPEHGEHPEVIVNSDNVNLKCCCKGFQSKLTDMAKEEMGRQAKDGIKNTINQSIKKFNRR